MKSLINLSLVLATLITSACSSKSSSNSQPQKEEEDRIIVEGLNTNAGNDGKDVTTADTEILPVGNQPNPITPVVTVVDGADGADGTVGANGVSANGANGGVSIVTSDANGKSLVFVSNGGTATIGNNTVTAPATGCIAIVDGKKTEGKDQAACDQLQIDLGITALLQDLLP